MYLLWLIFVFGIKKLALSLSDEETAEALLNLVNRPLDPKGEPFPKIPGPKKDQRVCIVGAGPSGVHMALRLKELDYQNVEVFEATGIVGGKAKDYDYQNISYPFGAMVLINNYNETAYPLFKKYTGTRYVKLIPLTIKETNKIKDPGIEEPLYYLKRMSKLTGIKNPIEVTNRMTADVKRYYEIYHEMFGKFQGELMHKPSKEVLFRLRGSIRDFFEREGLDTLIPFSSSRVFLNVFGKIEDIGALYYMMGALHQTPLLMALALLGADKFPYHLFLPRDSTFAKLFQTIVAQEKLKVKLNSEVVNVEHSPSGQVLLDIVNKETSKSDRQTCDFLIWTALSPVLMNIYKDASDEEKRLLGTINTHRVVTSVVKKKDDVRIGPSVFYVDSRHRTDNYGVVTEIYMKDFLYPEDYYELTVDGWLKPDNKSRTSLVYQQGPHFKDDEPVRREINNHYQNLGASEIDILAMQPFDYFPRWSKEELEGKHWEVFDIQGKRNIWYAGSSVSFESVASVLEYNNLLLRQME